mgnify:CR=1 FL=1
MKPQFLHLLHFLHRAALWYRTTVPIEKSEDLEMYVSGTDKYNRVMNMYGQSCKVNEKATLSSRREVKNAANMFYYTEE